MSTTDWAEGEPRAEKRGVPSWVWWGCGGGCLLALVLLAGALFFFGSLLREAFDPERAWAGVNELLPHDERPEGWEAIGTARGGVGVYFLDPPGEEAFVIVQRARTPAEVATLLDPSGPANGSLDWFLDPVEHPEAGTILLQGREARCLRYSGGSPRDGGHGVTGGLRVDVTGAGVPTVLHLLTAGGAQAEGDERVRALLAPFDLWRGR